jgi:hypothetical protein
MVEKKKKTTRKNVGKTILINVVIFIIGFTVLDFILGKTQIPYNFNLFRIKHPYYHHGMMANSSQFTAWGKHLHKIYTNSLGFKDKEMREIPLKTDNKRILILGDSHSEGVGVEFSKTFAGILQQKGEKQGIEVLNASAVSYSPKIVYLKADYLLNTKNLDVDEIWALIDISDLQNEIAYESFQPSQPGPTFAIREKVTSFLEKNSFTYFIVKSRREAKRINAFVKKMQEFDPSKTKNLQKNTIELYEDFFRDFDDDDMLRSPEFHGVGEWYYNSSTLPLAKKGILLGQANMARLDSLCDAKGIHLVLGVHPWHSQIHKQQISDFYVSSWKSFCQDREIEFINLFPLFINGENPYSVVKRYYIPNDNHWNEEGHEKVGDFLSGYL